MARRAVSILRKLVTAKEIRSGRFPVPAKVRDQVLPYLAGNTYTPLTMVDEHGFSHSVVVKLRGNRTKPEIMSRGGRRFAIRRNLVAGAILVFSRSDLPGHFNVAVLPPCTPLPPAEERRGLSSTFHPPSAVGIGISSLSAQTSLLHFPTFSSAATAQTGFGLPIITHHQLGELLKPSSTTMPLRFGSFLGLNHPLGEPSTPVPMTMDLGLSLSIGSVQPPSPANIQMEQPTAIPEEQPTQMNMELGLGLSIGLDRSMGDPPKPSSAVASLRFGSFVGSNHLGASPKPTVAKGFGLSFGSDDQSKSDQPKPSSATMSLRCGSFIDMNHGEPQNPTAISLKLGLGLSTDSVQPPSPANTPHRFSLSDSSEKWQVDPLIPNPEETYTLDLTLSIGTIHHSTTAPQAPELSLSGGYDIVATPEITTPNQIKSEAQEVEWYPNLSLLLVEKESNVKPPAAPYLDAAYWGAGHDLQEPKPPTSLCAAKPCFSVLEPYIPLGLF